MNARQKKAAAKKRNSSLRKNPTWTEEEWSALKKVLKWCQRCGSGNNLTMDHLVPIGKGGKNSLDNLELLCYDCNKKKAAKKLSPGTPTYLLPSQEEALASLPEPMRTKITEAIYGHTTNY